MPERFLDVVSAGPQTTVQDLGRAGHAHLGVPRSGALDQPAHRLANRLVGNAEDAAAVETTMLGVDLRLDAGRWVAVTGAESPVRVDGRDAGMNGPRYVPAGSILSVGPADRGVRAYVAVAGGLDVPPVLGSRATDTLSGVGPARLADGDRLPLGPPRSASGPVEVAPRPGIAAAVEVRLVPGPRTDRLTASARDLLGSSAYEVTPVSDRVGTRLRGPRLEVRSGPTLPSEGIVLGAVQLPPEGQPLVFLADHPTTGGYPVVGAVHPADLGLVAQARPGSTVRFRWVR
jgi:biotin-dependent carboxylase-like uncharacterized protein